MRTPSLESDRTNASYDGFCSDVRWRRIDARQLLGMNTRLHRRGHENERDPLARQRSVERANRRPWISGRESALAAMSRPCVDASLPRPGIRDW